jgi:hypothetical protein
MVFDVQTKTGTPATFLALEALMRGIHFSESSGKSLAFFVAF